MQERNFVWDTLMIESFGQLELEHLKLNAPYHVPDSADVEMQGLGSFHHKDLQLIWTGISKRNGQECAVVDYQAFFNQVAFSNPVLSLIGEATTGARSGCRWRPSASNTPRCTRTCWAS